LFLFCAQLNLSGNNLGPEGAAALAPAIAVSASLTTLVLREIELGDEGVTVLCNALRESTVSKVQELDLRSNDIGPGGAKAIARALCVVVASITLLDLSHNRLGSEGAKALAPGLKANASLTKCGLIENEFGDEGWTSIFDALRDSPTSKINTWDLSQELGPLLAPKVAKPLADYISGTASASITSVRSPAHANAPPSHRLPCFT